VRIAIVQIRTEGDSPDASRHNLDKALEAIEQVAGEADVICFAEYFLGKAAPSPLPNVAISALQVAASQAHLNVICGVIREQRAGTGNFLVSLVINRYGDVTAAIDKVVLYPGEKLWYRAGEGALLAYIDDEPVGILSGYDLLHPNLVYNVIQEGAQALICQISADEPGYLETLQAVVVTRALEHLLPVVAVGQLGESFGREHLGGSIICEPRLTDEGVPGAVETLLRMENEEELWVVDLDLRSFREMRRLFNFYRRTR
jgi:predicted amidohydrolase